jgi:hypothetical protein
VVSKLVLSMGYLIDRQRALWTPEVVVVLSVRQRGIRSRVILKDNSLYLTLTRPGTLRRRSEQEPQSALQRGRGRLDRKEHDGQEPQAS